MRRAANKNVENNNEKLKKKFNINLDRKKITAIIILVCILIVIIIVNNYTSLGLVINRNINSEDAVQIELQSSNSKIIPYGDQVLVYSKGRIVSYDSYGKNTGEIVLQDTIEADVLTAGKYIQVVNKDKDVVYVYKNKYEVARIKVDGEVYSANINSDGTSVIEYSSNGTKTALGIYDGSGNMKYNIKLSNNVIGKYVLSDNSRYLSYVDVNVSGISVTTNINLIDLSNIDEQASAKTIHAENNVLAYDLYWSGKNVIARFDESYMIYNTSSNTKEIILVGQGQISNIADYSNRYAYTELDEKGNYILSIKKMSSDNKKRISISDAPKYFEYENGIIYICYQKAIEIYNNFGMNIKNYTSDTIITKPIIFNSGRSLAMAISNKLIMFTI